MSLPNQQSIFPSGIWTGFFIESRPERGWMHLYLDFSDGEIKGEGTDYVGPYHIRGSYSDETGVCNWTKQYVGKHDVFYQGRNEGNGIVGIWTIGQWLQGTFHIWPKGHGGLEERYMQEDMPTPNAF